MGKLFILCLLLCTFKLCYCVYDISDTRNCFAKYDRNRWMTTRIVLLGDVRNIDDDYPRNNLFNGLLYALNNYEKYYNRNEYVLDRVYLPNNLMKTIFNDYNDTESLTIHLNVKGFYQYNYNEFLKQNYTFAGDMGPKITKRVCRSEVTAGMNDVEICKKSVEIQRNVKIVSNSVLKHKPLYELISRIDIRTDPKIMLKDIANYYNADECVNIVVCDKFTYVPKEIRQEYNNKIRFITNGGREDAITEETKCEDAITEETLAVLTSVPFKLSKFDQLYTPTIFYDHTYIMPETADVFVNGLSIVNQTDIMEHSFLHFLIKKNWRRVGIISDKSLYSSEFEETLTSLLRKENFIVGSKSCLDPDCDFSEIFESFAEAEARVVIANVPDTLALEFASQVSTSRLGQRNIAWLVRGWSSVVAKEAAQTMGTIFSITLGPKMYYTRYLNTYRRPDEEYVSTYKVDPLIAVLDMLETYRISPSDIRGAGNKRKYMQIMKKKIYENVSIYTYVKRYQRNENPSYRIFSGIVATMLIKDYSLQEYHPHDHPSIAPDIIKDCFIKSNVYFKPCSDTDVMLIILISSIFMITCLAIVFFFHDKSLTRMA